MNLYLIEGMIRNADAMTEKIMEEHKVYTQKAMDSGMTLMAGLKSDMSGGIFFMRADSLEQVEAYLELEPFRLYGIQDYKITKFDAHFINPLIEKWRG